MRIQLPVVLVLHLFEFASERSKGQRRCSASSVVVNP